MTWYNIAIVKGEIAGSVIRGLTKTSAMAQIDFLDKMYTVIVDWLMVRYDLEHQEGDSSRQASSDGKSTAEGAANDKN